MRSKWKGKYIAPQFLKKRKASKIIYMRSSVIPRRFLYRRIKIHNGNQIMSIRVKRNMLGHKIGEFSLTKIMGSSIHLKKKKNIKNNKKKNESCS